jgi:hypothetical protein
VVQYPTFVCKGICAHTERRHCRGGTSTPFASTYPKKTGAHSEHGSHAPPKHASTTPPPKTGTVNTCTRASESTTGLVVAAVPRHATFGYLRANTRRYTWAPVGEPIRSLETPITVALRPKPAPFHYLPHSIAPRFLNRKHV